MPHVHTMSAVAAKAATCSEAGRYVYYYCAGCDKVFKDETGTQETTVEAEMIAKLAHDFSDNAQYCKYNCGTANPNYVAPVTDSTSAEEVKPVAEKATNTFNVKAKKPTVKYSKLKKKNQTIALKNAMTVTKAQGIVTYTKSSGNKKITINKKTGKITVKKA